MSENDQNACMIICKYQIINIIKYQIIKSIFLKKKRMGMDTVTSNKYTNLKCTFKKINNTKSEGEGKEPTKAGRHKRG